MESFFHGKSSGFDPLVSYFDKAIYKSGSQIHLLEESNPQIDCQIFLVNSNTPRSGKTTIQKFVERLDEKVESMETALEKEDMTELASLAHWLKGAGGTVGYDDLTKPAQDLESFAKADHLEKANQSLKEVKSLVRAIVPPVI